jgi:hypothetical protein
LPDLKEPQKKDHLFKESIAPMKIEDVQNIQIFEKITLPTQIENIDAPTTVLQDSNS